MRTLLATMILFTASTAVAAPKEKDEDAIKECIRKNEHVSITLYRANNQLVAQPKGHENGNDASGTLHLELPLKPAVGR